MRQFESKLNLPLIGPRFFKITQVLTVVILWLSFSLCEADVPRLISYQGVLNDETGYPVDGNVSMTFNLYDVLQDGSSLWTETQSVEVSNGVFNVQLGSSTQLDPVIFEHESLYLGIIISPDTEMTPRQRVTTSSYSMRAGESLAQLSCANKEVARFDTATDSWLCFPQQWEVISHGSFNLDISLTGEYDWYRLTVNATGSGTGELKLKLNSGDSYWLLSRDSLGNTSSGNSGAIFLVVGAGYSGSIAIPNNTNNAYFSFNQPVPESAGTVIYQQTNFAWTMLSRIELIQERDVRGSYVLEGLRLPPP